MQQKNTISDQEDYTSKIKSTVEQQIDALFIESNEMKSMLEDIVRKNTLLLHEIDSNVVEKEPEALSREELLQMM